MRHTRGLAVLALLPTLLSECASSSVLSPTKLAESTAAIRSIRVQRYGADCVVSVEDSPTISEICSHFRRLRAGAANEMRSFYLFIEQTNGSTTKYVLGDNWAALVQTGHTYHTSAWRFRDTTLLALLNDLADARCK
jgi:hypothetical protein